MFEQGIKKFPLDLMELSYIESWASHCIYFPAQLDYDIAVSITVGLPEL